MDWNGSPQCHVLCIWNLNFIKVKKFDPIIIPVELVRSCPLIVGVGVRQTSAGVGPTPCPLRSDGGTREPASGRSGSHDL